MTGLTEEQPRHSYEYESRFVSIRREREDEQEDEEEDG